MATVLHTFTERFAKHSPHLLSRSDLSRVHFLLNIYLGLSCSAGWSPMLRHRGNAGEVYPSPFFKVKSMSQSYFSKDQATKKRIPNPSFTRSKDNTATSIRTYLGTAGKALGWLELQLQSNIIAACILQLQICTNLQSTGVRAVANIGNFCEAVESDQKSTRHSSPVSIISMDFLDASKAG